MKNYKDKNGIIWDDSFSKDYVDIELIRKYADKIDKSVWKKTYTTVDIESYPPKTDSVSKTEYNRAVDDKNQSQQKAKLAEDTIDALTAGNIDMQRALIKIDPHNIRYIKNPYVDVQLEAVMADATCYSKIKNPAQEVVDMYGFVK